MPRNIKSQNWWKEKRGTNSTLKKGKTTNTLSMGKLSFGVPGEITVRLPSFFSPSPPPTHFLSYIFHSPFFITMKHTLILDNIMLFTCVLSLSIIIQFPGFHNHQYYYCCYYYSYCKSIITFIVVRFHCWILQLLFCEPLSLALALKACFSKITQILALITENFSGTLLSHTRG